MDTNDSEFAPLETATEAPPALWPAVLQYLLNTADALNALPQFADKPLTVFDVINRILADRMARELAVLAVYGDVPQTMPEFTATDVPTLSGDLLTMLIPLHVAELRAADPQFAKTPKQAAEIERMKAERKARGL